MVTREFLFASATAIIWSSAPKSSFPREIPMDENMSLPCSFCSVFTLILCLVCHTACNSSRILSHFVFGQLNDLHNVI